MPVAPKLTAALSASKVKANGNDDRTVALATRALVRESETP